MEKSSLSDNGKGVHDELALVPTDSVVEGQLKEVHEEDGHLHRSFSPHQVHIISLGSNIGSGLFIGSGASLAAGGPGNIVIAYSLVCSCVWAVLQTLSEMTIAFPVSGNFIDYADRWVDPALGFGAGFAEWLGWVAIVGSEAGFFNILVQFWGGNTFPLAASLTLFLVASLIVFLLPNKAFAWFEYVTSLIKVFIFLLIIVLGFAIILGAGPGGHIRTGRYWRELEPFKNGFSGFANAAILATWAVGDQVFIGIMGGEAENPRFSMAHAAKLVPLRVAAFYMICIIWITLLVPSNDERLLGGGGIAASPFIIAIQEANIPALPHILNAGIICGILAIATEATYISSRMLRTMSHQRLIPAWFAKVDSKGRPVRSLAITAVFATMCTYINLSAGGAVGLAWLVQITAASFFVNWIIISFTSYRFHLALKVQNDPLFTELYAWKMQAYPTPPAWLMTMCMVLLISAFTIGIKPPGSTLSEFSAYSFFQYTLGIWIIVGLTLIYKIVYRTKLRNLAEVDLKSGRRVLSDGDLKQLNDYYSMPSWRRFLTYLQMW